MQPPQSAFRHSNFKIVLFQSRRLLNPFLTSDTGISMWNQGLFSTRRLSFRFATNPGSIMKTRLLSWNQRPPMKTLQALAVRPSKEQGCREVLPVSSTYQNHLSRLHPQQKNRSL